MTTAQLVACGVSRTTIRRWVGASRLHRVSDGLYAVGHAGTTAETPLIEALLTAGPGAALSHITAAWWRGLIRFPGRVIHVSAPGRRRSRPGIQVHHPIEIKREWHNGLPIVPVPQILLDIAPMISFPGLRRALAVADREGLMSLKELEALGDSGRRGSAAVREAYRVHMPQLARTRSPLEDKFLFFCDSNGIELPKINYEIAGYEVDAVWPEIRLAAEIDGREEHGTPAAVVVDRRRELAVRQAGFELLRYGSEQLDYESDATASDLRAAIARAQARCH